MELWRYNDHESRYNEHEGDYNDHSARFNEHEGDYNDHSARCNEHEGDCNDHSDRCNEHEGDYNDHSARYNDHEGDCNDCKGFLFTRCNDLYARCNDHCARCNGFYKQYNNKNEESNMAILKNNSYTDDDDGVRNERCLHLQNNIDTYAAEIGCTGVHLTWAQGCYDTWTDLCATTIVEDGQKQEATQEYQKKFAECREYYQNAKDLLKSIIWEYEKPDEIEEAYGVRFNTPRSRPLLVHVIKAFKIQHDLFEAAGDPRVIADSIVTQMVTLKDEMEDMATTAGTEKREASQAFDNKQNEFTTGSDRLKIIYNMAKIVWGNDDPRLFELGFVPKSAIWTENKPPHPTNFIYDDVAKKFTWDAVEGVDEYEIDYRLTGASGDWTQLYKGANTSTATKPAEPGDYDFRIRSWKGDDSGSWSGVLLVNFPDGAPLPAPTNFTFDDAKQEFSWDKLELALMYELEIKRPLVKTNGNDGAGSLPSALADGALADGWTQIYKDIDRYFDASTQDAGDVLARVRALDGYQEPGEWSDPPLAVQFKLRTPDFLAYGQYKNEFICGFVPNAEGYRFELGQVGGTVEVIDVSENHFVRDLGFGDWNVRVRAYRGAEFSDWTQAIEVHIIFVMPDDLEYNAGAKRIDWRKVADEKMYHLVNESGTISYIGAAHHFDIELTAPEKFRVRAGDDKGNWGEWTEWTMLG